MLPFFPKITANPIRERSNRDMRCMRLQFLQTWKIKFTKSQETDQCAVDLKEPTFLFYGRHSDRCELLDRDAQPKHLLVD